MPLRHSNGMWWWWCTDGVGASIRERVVLHALLVSNNRMASLMLRRRRYREECPLHRFMSAISVNFFALERCVAEPYFQCSWKTLYLHGQSKSCDSDTLVFFGKVKK